MFVVRVGSKSTTHNWHMALLHAAGAKYTFVHHSIISQLAYKLRNGLKQISLFRNLDNDTYYTMMIRTFLLLSIVSSVRPEPGPCLQDPMQCLALRVSLNRPFRRSLGNDVFSGEYRYFSNGDFGPIWKNTENQKMIWSMTAGRMQGGSSGVDGWALSDWGSFEAIWTTDEHRSNSECGPWEEEDTHWRRWDGVRVTCENWRLRRIGESEWWRH